MRKKEEVSEQEEERKRENKTPGLKNNNQPKLGIKSQSKSK